MTPDWAALAAAAAPNLLPWAAWVAACAAIAALMPPALDAALRRKHRAVAEAFRRRIARLEETEASFAGEEPSRADADWRWARDMAELARLGKVEPWMREELVRVKVVDPGEAPVRELDVDEGRWSFPASPGRRALLALSAAALSAAALAPVLLGQADPAAAGSAISAMCLLLVAGCALDLRARVLPWQLCAAAAPLSALCALAVRGTGALPECAAVGLAAFAVLLATSRLAGALGHAGGIGGGDLRLIPWAAAPCGAQGILAGAAAGCAVMFAWAAALVLLRRRGGGSGYLAFAPALAVLFAAGLAFPALAAA